MSEEWLKHKLAILTYCAKPRSPSRGYKITFNGAEIDTSRRVYVPTRAHRKLTDEQVKFIRNSNEKLRVLSKLFNISHRAIWDCRKGYTYKDVT